MSTKTAKNISEQEVKDVGNAAGHVHAAHQTPHPKTGVEKTQGVLTLISTCIGIAGAVGTAAVWLMSTFYVGHLELKTANEVAGMSVKVYTKDGHESIFHTKWIDLMPGKYHIEIAGPKGASQHEDLDIAFNQTKTVSVKFADEAPAEAPGAGTKSTKKKKRWFQFWKSGEDEGAAEDESAPGAG